MARWFNKESDRLSEEIARLERDQKRLEKQAELIARQMDEPIQQEEKEITRMAKFKLEPSSRPTGKDGRKKKRLRVHQKRARNRFFIMFGVLLILALILWRLLF
ncbi:MAG: hypothetical protein AAF571_10990 [Verrucomicrobiota bacterium]